MFLTSSFIFFLFFFFNDTATTEIYTLSLHDALPISGLGETMTDGMLILHEMRTRLMALAPTPEQQELLRSEERRVGKSVDLGGRRRIYKKCTDGPLLSGPSPARPDFPR